MEELTCKICGHVIKDGERYWEGYECDKGVASQFCEHQSCAEEKWVYEKRSVRQILLGIERKMEELLNDRKGKHLE